MTTPKRHGSTASVGRGVGRWSLQDAKARLSEVVRRAREEGPQRVTVHGKDAVVVVSAEAYDREHARGTGRALVDALADSPLSEVELDGLPVKSPVRDVSV